MDYAKPSDVAAAMVDAGMKKLGMDPATIKYAVISPSHPDHYGGGKFLQDKYGTKVYMSKEDWDGLDRANGTKPARDLVATDGQKLTLGDTTVTMYFTPGHTPGTLSMLFTVKDNGKPINVAYSGGTAFNFPSTVPNFDTYINSQSKMADAAASSNATILMSNHSELGM